MRYPRILMVVVAALAGCGGDAGGADAAISEAGADGVAFDTGTGDAMTPDSSGADAAPDGGLDATVDAAPSCTPTLGPGTTTETIEFGGATREYILSIPTADDGTRRLPLVLDIHGYTESAGRQEGRSGMRAEGEDEGFIVVQPEGSGALKSWNGGACCGTAASGDLDDVGLMRAIVADVAARACVDLSRVYATGLSNGGFLSHRLACEASDLVAAIAPVASVIGVPMDECTPGAAVPVMHVHGTSDFLVPYDGNFFYPSVQATVEHWVTTNGCDDTPAVTLDASRTTCETWSGCRDGSEVVLCTIEGGGHEWPPESSGLSTTDAIWDFLSRHTR